MQRGMLKRIRGDGEEMTLKERLLQLYKNKEISENSYQRYIKLIEIIQTKKENGILRRVDKEDVC